MEYTTYEDFNKAKVACRACPIGPVYNCVVPSLGQQIKPRVVFIGEAAGQTEIIQKEPFCGRSGKLLRETMNSVGFRRINTLITNTIPCRPQDNKFPQDDKVVNYCVENWLMPELKLTDPDFIVLIGSNALKYVLGLTGITKHRGKWYRFPNWYRHVDVLATWHPSYILRMENSGNTEILRQFQDDLQEVATKAGIFKQQTQTESVPVPVGE